MASSTGDHRAIVLIVEDEALIRMVGTDMLEEAGYKVLEAESADEALGILEQAPDIQLMFTDIRMPGSMDGLALASLVHSRWPGIKLLLTSGHINLEPTEIPDEGLFLPKPYNAAGVIGRIRNLLPDEM